MQDPRDMDLEQCLALAQELAANLGEPAPQSFDSLGEARMAVLQLQERVNSGGTGDEAAPAAETKDKGGISKYNTAGRRGPSQGIGAYAKAKILEGLDNKAILEDILATFPGAKTSMSSISFYRNALKHPAKGKTPEALREKAEALRAEADKLDAAATAAEEAAAKPEAEEAAV